MAPASPPRRSSRARVNGTTPQHPLGSSARGERSTRHTAHNKSSTKSLTPSASIASEPPDDFHDANHHSRRRKRGHEDGNPRARGAATDDEDEDMASDDLQDEDDAVRCICGSDEYPGLPVFTADPRHSADASFYETIELNEDVIGFFLQCDTCKVWQHGACVGIISTEVSPDEYFCEQCREDLHRIHADSNGQNYSHYLPTRRPSRNVSVSRAASHSKDGSRSPKHSSVTSSNHSSSSNISHNVNHNNHDIHDVHDVPDMPDGHTIHSTTTISININTKENTKSTRLSANSLQSKRRSTMNSRDAAYDAEQLTLAIEASKEDTKDPVDGEVPQRRTKRGRSESEECVSDHVQTDGQTHNSPSNSSPMLTIASNVITVKRQRTSSVSVSVSPSTENTDTTAAHDSDEGSATRNGRRSRAPSRSQRDKNAEDMEVQRVEEKDKAKQRVEQSNKRKDRAERRRADADLEPVKELPTEPVEPEAEPEPAPPALPPPDTPPPQKQPANNSHKKPNRSHQKKAKGRNQYTKDRDISRDVSPAKSVVSRELPKVLEETPVSHPAAKSSTSDAKHAPKHKSSAAHHHHAKVSMPDMKRRAAAYLEFITRTQVELALDVGPWPLLPGGDTDNSTGKQSQPRTNGNGPVSQANGAHGEADFKDLNSMEMMDILTRKLVKWQNQFAE